MAQNIEWCSGTAECMKCLKSFMAVWPLGADSLECMHCGSMDTIRSVGDYMVGKSEMQADEPGAHHCTRENISSTIGRLRDIESGREDYRNLDVRTMCGVLALQMSWLLSLLDS